MWVWGLEGNAVHGLGLNDAYLRSDRSALWWQLSTSLLKDKSAAPFLHRDGKTRCVPPCVAPVPNLVCDLKPPVRRICAQMLDCKLAQLWVQTLPCVDFSQVIKHESVFPPRRDYGGISFPSIQPRVLRKLPKKMCDKAWLEGNKQNQKCHELQSTLFFLKGREESP